MYGLRAIEGSWKYLKKTKRSIYQRRRLAFSESGLCQKKDMNPGKNPADPHKDSPSGGIHRHADEKTKKGNIVIMEIVEIPRQTFAGISDVTDADDRFQPPLHLMYRTLRRFFSSVVLEGRKDNRNTYIYIFNYVYSW